MHLKRLTVVARVCNLRAEEVETGRFLARQPSLGTELQATERLCLKNRRGSWVKPEKQCSDLVSGLHMYMNKLMRATYKYMYAILSLIVCSGTLSSQRLRQKDYRFEARLVWAI